MSRRPIRVMPRDVAERIAAGEVIDRPAAAAKELIENALDAGARSIHVEARGGGLELLRVADDGDGILPDELPLAFARHATSKLDRLEDLQALGTLGFRGEALPSIAAISEVTCTTAIAGGRAGAAITLRFGEAINHEARARASGTTVTVRDLFGNMPARRRFLKGQRAESARIGDVVRRYALGRPEVAFTLTFDGRLAFRSAGEGRAAAVIASLYGAGAAESLAAVEIALTGGGAMRGHIGAGGPWHCGRQHVTLFVNGRWVRGGGLAAAVEAAYRPFAPAGRHPLALLWFTIPPEQLDPNVHPAKLEVRLLNEEAVNDAVREAVTASFGRTPAGAGASAALQYRLPLARHRVADPPARYTAGGETAGFPVALRFLATARDGVILAEGSSGLYLVDQHRAHERILYEELQAGAGGQPQALLEPALLRLPAGEAAMFHERAGELAALGFVVEPFGGAALVARSAPALIGGVDAAALAELLDGALRDAAGWRDRLLATAACRAAVKKGRPVDADTARSLLERLQTTAAPAVCPHGSPVTVQIDDRLLTRLFRW